LQSLNHRSAGNDLPDVIGGSPTTTTTSVCHGHEHLHSDRIERRVGILLVLSILHFLRLGGRQALLGHVRCRPIRRRLPRREGAEILVLQLVLLRDRSWSNLSADSVGLHPGKRRMGLGIRHPHRCLLPELRGHIGRDAFLPLPKAPKLQPLHMLLPSFRRSFPQSAPRSTERLCEPALRREDRWSKLGRRSCRSTTKSFTRSAYCRFLVRILSLSLHYRWVVIWFLFHVRSPVTSTGEIYKTKLATLVLH
jgi:hypothetical protein